MSIVVETGAGLTNANAYLSEADADAYFADRGNPTAWTGANKAAALIYATAHIDGRYNFVGSVQVLTQSLKWPRLDAYDDEGRLEASGAVPTRIEYATAELALLHLSTALNSTHSRGGQVTREKVGSLEVSYADGAPAEVQTPHVTRILSGLLSTGLGVVTIGRG